MGESDRLASISHVISAQIFSRAITFAMNIGIARFADVADYGIGFVAFQLFSNLSLFSTKEGCRKVALRSDDKYEKELAANSSRNIAWLGVLTTILSCAPLVVFWIRDHPTYVAEVFILAAGSILESIAEPFLVATLLRSDFKSRAMSEGAAILVRTLFIFVWLVARMGTLPRAFACASIVFSIVWLSCLMRGASSFSCEMPKRLHDGSWFLSYHWELLWVFAAQALMKLFLAEGEKVILLAAYDESSWGVYGLVSNFGSIILRLIFAPVEEIAYAAFGSKGGEASSRLALFRALLCLQGLIGWLGLCFGPSFAQLVIRILYGQSWMDAGAPQALAFYCILLFFMALNGIFEAYSHAVASAVWLKRMQLASLGISAVLVGTAWVGRSFGPIALIIANSLAMLLRVLLCAVFMMSSEVNASLHHFCPPLKIFGLVSGAGLLCAFLVPDLSQHDRVPWMSVVCAVACACSLLLVIGYVGRHDLRALVAAARGAKKKDD